jgi:hypothetical protein
MKDKGISISVRAKYLRVITNFLFDIGGIFPIRE